MLHLFTGGIDFGTNPAMTFQVVERVRGLTPADVEALANGREPENPYKKLAPDEERNVRTLITQLGSDAYAKRESAAKQLRDMGRKIFPLLREYRDTDDIEISNRVKSLLGELPKTETDK